MKNSNPGTKLRYSLAVLQVLIGIGAVAGGYMLLSDTSGSRMGFTLDLLEGSPFSTYLIPGAYLFAINGLGNLLGAAASIKRHQVAGSAAVLLGAAMMVWIIVQVLVTGPLHWLQPLYFGLGLVESVLGIRLRGAGRAQ